MQKETFFRFDKNSQIFLAFRQKINKLEFVLLKPDGWGQPSGSLSFSWKNKNPKQKKGTVREGDRAESELSPADSVYNSLIFFGLSIEMT